MICMRKEVIGGIFGFAAIGLVVFTFIAVVGVPVQAQDAIEMTTYDASSGGDTIKTCPLSGEPCDGNCGGSCAAAQTGSCGCAAKSAGACGL